MKVIKYINRLLFIPLCIVLFACAESKLVFNNDNISKELVSLEGHTFKGVIRTTGLLGLFGVNGVLSFNGGLLIWQVDDQKESGQYQIKKSNNVLKFTCRVFEKNGTYVDWSGEFDGQSLSNVKAIWTRIDEDDFFHDLFLSDIVSFTFTQKN